MTAISGFPGVQKILRPMARQASGALILAALLTAALPAGPALAQTAAATGPAATGPTVPVTTAVATRQNVPILLRNIGVVQPFNSVLVRARVDGNLDRVFFTEGQDVKPGDKLAQIDPRPYAAALAQAQAKKASDTALLSNAQRDMARYSNLVRNDFASRQQVDTQAATVQQLQATIQGDDATVQTAQLNLDYTNITSPINGRTGFRLVDPGNLIHATDSTGLVTITQIHPIAIFFTLPQDTLPSIQAAMAKGKLPVTAYTSDDQTKLSVGELATVDNAIDQTTGTIKLKATFTEQRQGNLWPGQFVNARLLVRHRSQGRTVVIPSAAVQRGPKGEFVYVRR